MIYLMKPIYLYLYLLINNPGLAFIACVVITILILVPIITISYTFIESLGIKLGQQLIYFTHKNQFFVERT